MKMNCECIALIPEDSLFPRAVVKGASELAKKRGIEVVFAEAYPQGTTDFSAILTKVRATTPDAFVAATFFEDGVTITRQMKQLNMNPKMYAVTQSARNCPNSSRCSDGPRNSSTDHRNGSLSWWRFGPVA